MAKTAFRFGDLDVVEFAQGQSTPFYLFSESDIRSNFSSLYSAAERFLGTSFQIAYSIKNNSIPKIVASLDSQGCLFEVTSKGEMLLLDRLGVSLSRCIYTNIWKPDEALDYAIARDLGYFAIDSFSDMRRLDAFARKHGKKTRVLIRVNPSIEMVDTIFASSTPCSKTGAEIMSDSAPTIKGFEDAYNLTKMCVENESFDVVGLHGHLGSQVTNPNYFKEFSRKICAFFKEVESGLGVNLRVLDLGGGIPVRYRDTSVLPSAIDVMQIYANALNTVGISPHIILEIGRYLTSLAGILVTRIVAVKKNPTVGTIVVTDAAAYNDLLDSVLVHWDFDMTLANKFDQPRSELVWVVGSTTDSIDVFDPLKNLNARRTRFLQMPEEGDLLIVFGAGAYTTCFNMNYCMRPMSPVYLVDASGQIHTARRAQSLEGIFSDFSW